MTFTLPVFRGADLRLCTWRRRVSRVFQDRHVGATSDGADPHGLRTGAFIKNIQRYICESFTVFISACVKGTRRVRKVSNHNQKHNLCCRVEIYACEAQPTLQKSDKNHYRDV